MNLTYDDTIEDLIETMAGGALGAMLTLLRHPARLRNVPGRAADPVVEVEAKRSSGPHRAAAST